MDTTISRVVPLWEATKNMTTTNRLPMFLEVLKIAFWQLFCYISTISSENFNFEKSINFSKLLIGLNPSVLSHTLLIFDRINVKRYISEVFIFDLISGHCGISS